jgi:flagellar motor component MotA
VYEGRQEMMMEKKRTGGTSNLEKQKQKNFNMVKKSTRVVRKQHTSLRQQQQALKKHIKTMERTSKVVQKARRRQTTK